MTQQVDSDVEQTVAESPKQSKGESDEQQIDLEKDAPAESPRHMNGESDADTQQTGLKRDSHAESPEHMNGESEAQLTALKTDSHAGQALAEILAISDESINSSSVAQKDPVAQQTLSRSPQLTVDEFTCEASTWNDQVHLARHLRIRVIGAAGCLRRAEHFVENSHLCVSVQMESGVGRVETTAEAEMLDPEWNEDVYIDNYEPDQSLIFQLWDRNSGIGRDDCIANATLASDVFLPSGCEQVELPLNGAQVQASLQVAVVVGVGPSEHRRELEARKLSAATLASCLEDASALAADMLKWRKGKEKAKRKGRNVERKGRKKDDIDKGVHSRPVFTIREEDLTTMASIVTAASRNLLDSPTSRRGSNASFLSSAAMTEANSEAVCTPGACAEMPQPGLVLMSQQISPDLEPADVSGMDEQQRKQSRRSLRFSTGSTVSGECSGEEADHVVAGDLKARLSCKAAVAPISPSQGPPAIEKAMPAEVRGKVKWPAPSLVRKYAEQCRAPLPVPPREPCGKSGAEHREEFLQYWRVASSEDSVVMRVIIKLQARVRGTLARAALARMGTFLATVSVYVGTVSTGEVIKVEIFKCASVLWLKKRLELMTGAPVALQHLSFQNAACNPSLFDVPALDDERILDAECADSTAHMGMPSVAFVLTIAVRAWDARMNPTLGWPSQFRIVTADSGESRLIKAGTDAWKTFLIAPAMRSGQHTVSFRVHRLPRGTIFLGAAAAHLVRYDHVCFGNDSALGFFISSYDGRLSGNRMHQSKSSESQMSPILEGQVVTIQADLDENTLRFWVDGLPRAAGYYSGVHGPLCFAVSMFFEGQCVGLVSDPHLADRWSLDVLTLTSPTKSPAGSQASSSTTFPSSPREISDRHGSPQKGAGFRSAPTEVPSPSADPGRSVRWCSSVGNASTDSTKVPMSIVLRKAVARGGPGRNLGSGHASKSIGYPAMSPRLPCADYSGASLIAARALNMADKRSGALQSPLSSMSIGEASSSRLHEAVHSAYGSVHSPTLPRGFFFWPLS